MVGKKNASRDYADGMHQGKDMKLEAGTRQTYTKKGGHD